MPDEQQTTLHTIETLLEIMAKLRHPEDGCPWDIEQDFKTIVPHTIEEAYEVADAIEQNDMPALRDELGDLLFQVVFHARMAEEAEDFDFHGVVHAICDKMIRRHPHVFGEAEIDSAEAQTRAWEDLKAEERAAKGANGASAAAGAEAAPASLLDDVPVTLPALTRAIKLQKRAARVGFDWTTPEPIFDKLEEEVAELKVEIADGGDTERLTDELGDVLFVAANLARRLGIDGEAALRHANAKFERRFRGIEAHFRDLGKDMAEATLEEMEAVWQAVKIRHRSQ